MDRRDEENFLAEFLYITLESDFNLTLRVQGYFNEYVKEVLMVPKKFVDELIESKHVRKIMDEIAIKEKPKNTLIKQNMQKVEEWAQIEKKRI